MNNIVDQLREVKTGPVEDFLRNALADSIAAERAAHAAATAFWRGLPEIAPMLQREHYSALADLMEGYSRWWRLDVFDERDQATICALPQRQFEAFRARDARAFNDFDVMQWTLDRAAARADASAFECGEVLRTFMRREDVAFATDIFGPVRLLTWHDMGHYDTDVVEVIDQEGAEDA